MEKGNITMQERAKRLRLLADRLLRDVLSGGTLYADEVSSLQRDIHRLIDELYPLRGDTPEEEASRCLALLAGYGVCMYANPEDDRKRLSVLSRSRRMLDSLSPSPLRERLLEACSSFS